MDRTYICIDLKSYYASVECVHRGLDPLKANLLVADESRSDQTICLAVSPSLKAKGVPGRPRLFEAKQKIREYEAKTHTKVDYIIAVPRMAEYERISAQIYGIYLRYVAPEDIHVYSIDECFIDCTCYLHAYRKEADKLNTNPAHVMAMTMIRDVLRTTGITATVGIGTNLYLAKVAMDIVAKKQPADRDGVRIAELNEDSYKFLLWDHKPLTDFWQIGNGKARRLEKAYMFTMGDIAARTQWDEEFFYKTFGIDGEILVDHAWGIEPVTMADIKSYKSDGHSLAITTPKTKSGVRIIPMLSDVKAALTEEYKAQLESGFNTSEVDGYSGFIFKSRYNTVLSPHCVNRAIDRIIKACNTKEEEDAKAEGREPELLPHFSCHHLRHTFCTRFCENETNLKVIQEIMGHADITTTMDIYNEATKDKKIESFAGLEGKIKIR